MTTKSKLVLTMISLALLVCVVSAAPLIEDSDDELCRKTGKEVFKLPDQILKLVKLFVIYEPATDTRTIDVICAEHNDNIGFTLQGEKNGTCCGHVSVFVGL